MAGCTLQESDEIGEETAAARFPLEYRNHVRHRGAHVGYCDGVRKMRAKRLVRWRYGMACLLLNPRDLFEGCMRTGKTIGWAAGLLWAVVGACVDSDTF